MKRISLLILAFIYACAFEVIAQNFVHPGVPFTTADLNHLKSNLTKEPWASKYAEFKNDYRSQPGYGPHAVVTVGRAPDVNRNLFINDMVAIHNLAFMWIFTGDQAYAKRGTEILDAWAVTNTRWVGDETFLDLGDQAQYFITGADILRSTYPGWTAENDAHVRNWFTNVLWKEVDVPNPLRGLNQGAIQAKVAVGIAAYLGDPVLWEQAIKCYRTDAGGGLPNTLSNGQVGDSGRDEGHWFGQVEALAWSAEVAWKQGIDLFGDLDNRILATSELYTGFRINSAPYLNNFIPFGGTYGYYTGWGGGSSDRQAMLYSIVYNAYTLRKGIAAPNTTNYREIRGESAYSFLFRRTIDNSTAAPLTPIQHPASVSTASLTSVDVGETGLAGSSAYNNGKWTLKGAGTGIVIPAQSQTDAFNFAFQKMTGNSVIITRVDTLLSNAGAQAGITFRESLEDDARQVALVLSSDGGLNLTWRNATAWSKTNISWNNPPGGYQNHYQPYAPWWLKLERMDDRVLAFHSKDGINWTCIGIVVTPLPGSSYAGIYATSRNASQLASAVFSNVSMTNTAPAGSPIITSATSAAATIGSAFNYSITATASPASYSAAGLPAGLTMNTGTGVISGIPTALGKYLVTISASNAQGTGSAVLVIDVFNDVAPSAPSNITLSNTGIRQVTLTWDAPDNATSYSVRHSENAGGPYTTLATGISSTTFTHVNAFPGNNYYVVTALSGTLESTPSAEASITLPPDIPNKPVVVNASGQIALHWPMAIGATSYNVKRAAVSGGPYTIIATGITDTAYVDTQLVNGTYYYYVVSGVISNLESNNSEEELGVPGATSTRWGSAPVSGLWSVSDNWEGGITPATPAILTFNSSGTTALTNDITSLEVPRFSFEQEAGAYTIAGNPVRMGNEIINKSGNAQALNMAMIVNGPLQVNAPNGAVILGGAISGTGSVAKRGSGWVYLTGANTYSGGTTIYDSKGGWGPNAPLNIAGTGTGSPGSPLTGPLGTGPVIMKGGALRNADATAVIYNDIIVEAGTKNFLYSEAGGLVLAGGFKGSGTIEHDGNDAPSGLHLSGNNSEFTGTFISVNRSSRHRIRFDAASTGSAKANWILNNSFTDGHRLSFNDTIHFGGLSGGGLFNSFNAPIISIGALNTNTTFSGVLNNSNISVVKVGTGILRFTGTNSNYGSTTVRKGTLLINGPYNSAVTVRGGTIGGNSIINNSVTVGTGAGTGSYLAPGDDNIGQLGVGGVVTLKADATLRVEFSGTAATMDKLVAKGLTLENAGLQFTDVDPGSLPEGISFTLVDNTGTSPVNGAFNGLPELAIVHAAGYEFHISYKGGDGNDIVLLDHRTTPALITSPTVAEGMKDQPFAYTITAINNPLSFSATGLPAGVTVDTGTGVISGVPTESGIFKVQLGTQDEKGAVSLTLNLIIQTNEAPPAPTGLSSVARNSFQLDLSWDRSPVSAFTKTYTLKRASVAGGPYTIIAQNLSDTTYSDKSLAPVTPYFYVISATNAIGEGNNSAEISDTTLFPNISPKVEKVFAVGSNAKVNLTWKPAYEAASYNVKRSLTPGGTFSTVANVTDTAYVDLSITSGTTYYYAISAVNLAGEGEPSNVVSALTDAAAFAYWPFDEGTGAISTDLWNAKKGTLTGTTAGWAKGVSDTGVKLAGSSYVVLPSGSFSSLTDFTVSSWVKLDEKKTWERVFDFGSNTNSYMFLTTTHNGGGVRYEVKVGNTVQQISSSYSVPTNVWMHLVVTLKGSTGTMYINGEAVGNNTAMTLTPQKLANTTQTWIGRSQWPADPYLSGTIDDFRVYGRALTAQEIFQMATTFAPTPPGNVTVIRANDVTKLAWNPSNRADSYTVLRGSVAGAYTTIATGVTDTMYTDPAPLKGKNYYVVFASKDNFRSAFSNAAQITMPPAVPGSIHASGWNNRVDLSWAASAAATAYDVRRSTSSEGPFTTVASVTTTTYRDNAVVNGTDYYYIISATNEGGPADGPLVSAKPVDNEVVNTWLHADIGSVGISGNAGFVNDALTIYGAGADIWGTADGLHFVYQALTGDGAIVARVNALQNTNSSAKAGVMIRETLNANSKHAIMNLMPGGSVEFIRRTATGGGSSVIGGTSQLFPHWVKLVRSGNTITAYRNTDGSNDKWVKVGTETITMNATVYIGVATTSHNTGAIAEARFDHVNVATSLPVITSESIADGIVTLAFADTVTATGKPYQFNATGLPDSLSIDIETGFISGVPATAGTFPVIVTATNALGVGMDTLTIVIARKTQSISFDSLAGKKLGDRDYELTASATSALPVTYSSSDTTIATVINGIVHILREGTTVITASQNGNDFYEPAEDVSRELVIIKLPHSPYGGTVRTVPGILEAEDFDTGGEGIAFHDSTIRNIGLQYRKKEAVDIEICKPGGYDVFETVTGEWLKYTIDVLEDGEYQLTLNLADHKGYGKVRVEIDGVDVTGSITPGDTGGPQEWVAIEKTIQLTSGLRAVTIFFETGGVRVDKLVFSKPSSSEALRTGEHRQVEAEGSALEISMYPNPVKDRLELIVSNDLVGSKFMLHDNVGIKMAGGCIQSNVLTLDMTSLCSGLYLLKIHNGRRMIVRKVIKE